MSLVGGLVFGVLSALGSFQVSQNPKNIWLSFGKFQQIDKKKVNKKGGGVSDKSHCLVCINRFKTVCSCECKDKHLVLVLL